MWGWLRELLVACLPFLKDTAKEIVQHEVKAEAAKTTDATKQQFQAIRERVKKIPPPEPPADGTPRR